MTGDDESAATKRLRWVGNGDVIGQQGGEQGGCGDSRGRSHPIVDSLSPQIPISLSTHSLPLPFDKLAPVLSVFLSNRPAASSPAD